jgi:hypothetical protein
MPGQVPCDRKHKARSQRPGSPCLAPATHYDRLARHNLCSRHALDCPNARPGTGVPWYADEPATSAGRRVC